MELNATQRQSCFEYLLRHADDRLVLGHRLSEWCGHAPILEESLALANIALDLIGQATHLYGLAAELEGSGRTEDDLAFLRRPEEFRNLQLVEQPNGDFAMTLVRQFLFDAYDVLFLEQLQRSVHPELGGIAGKALKEAQYHLRHSQQWLLRLGDGTEESHRRTQEALDELWRFSHELCVPDELDIEMQALGIGVDLGSLAEAWQESVLPVLCAATLMVPDDPYQVVGSRSGFHTEHLGYLLAEMQSLPRSFPGAQW
jgi:ring-1,2-phenylacetyl-CoA epoxidase subunit PaaC